MCAVDARNISPKCTSSQVTTLCHSGLGWYVSTCATILEMIKRGQPYVGGLSFLFRWLVTLQAPFRGLLALL